MKKALIIALAAFLPLFGMADTIPELITYYASKYDVSTTTMTTIVTNESSFNPLAIGDMGITCKKTGRPVRARGAVQITECYFPEITDAQAFDPDFAINFLAEKLSLGQCFLWSTCPLK